MFTNTTDFLTVGLPTVLAGIKRLDVLSVTYNNVAGYESGPVETGKEGLGIQVQNGNLHYSPLTDLVYSGNLMVARIGSEAMDEEARAAQVELESSLRIGTTEDASFLAVVYAGLSAFDEAVAFARKVKKDNPAAKVAVVTCDCDLTRKARSLVPMLRDKELDAVVVTSECGGRATMRDILQKIVSDWPSPEPVKIPA
jgi:hypothetical protein